MNIQLAMIFFPIDFDLYLKRPGSRGEICLNPERDITEYGIKKDVRKPTTKPLAAQFIREQYS